MPAAHVEGQLDPRVHAMVVREAPLVPFVLTKPQVRGVRTSLVPPPVRYHEAWIEES